MRLQRAGPHVSISPQRCAALTVSPAPPVQVNAAPARGPDHFPFQGFRDSGIGSQGVRNSLELMCKTKTTVINLEKPSYTLG
jgi:hypothetical protein